MLNRIKFRNCKSHFGFRWVIYTLNRKSKNKTLFALDKFVLKNLSAGTTYCFDDLPDFYVGIIESLYTAVDDKKFTNLISINCQEFKYKTPAQINLIIEDYLRLLDDQGRLIFSVNLDNLIYDRVNLSINTLIDQWILELAKMKLTLTAKLVNFNAPAGYGHCFFALTYDKQI